MLLSNTFGSRNLALRSHLLHTTHRAYSMSCATRILGKLATSEGRALEDTAPAGVQEWIQTPNRRDLQIGQYSVNQPLGQGGMGYVFQARHLILDKQVAIKFLREELTGDMAAATRFQQEVKALGALNTPHIVQAIDAGQWNNIPYLVTELLEGQDLWTRVQQRGCIDVETSSEYIRQALLGLENAHQHGFIHRDIKPSNLFIQNSGTLKLIDFGIALASKQSDRATQAGQFMGSVDYLSPEQASDPRFADARSDIYSLGCTWIYLLSGAPPFSDGEYPSTVAKLKGHMMDQPKYLRDPAHKLPQAVHDLLLRMTAKRPEDRPTSCQAILDELASLDLASRISEKSQGIRKNPAEWKKISYHPSSLIGLASLLIALALLSLPLVSSSATRNHERTIKNQEDSNSEQESDAMTLTKSPIDIESTRTLRNGTTKNAKAVVFPSSKFVRSSIDAH